MGSRKKRSVRRRLERFVLGLGMSVVAFVLERRVIRAIKRRGGAPPSRRPEAAADGPVFDVTEH